MDFVQKGGRGQPQIQTFFNIFLVKVKYCSKDTWNRPSWWTPIHKQYILQKLDT